ncbi:MAG: hypothetical protein IPJ26_05455 [Bacteroidetes bacterium]|nr:hypothetical protein [Bacteroidota bacterium]
MPEMFNVFWVGLGKTCNLPRAGVADDKPVGRTIIVFAVLVMTGSLKSK